jgi:hypothetical protein
MSSVDIVAIEEAMKMASLDVLRGYAQNHYAEVHQYATTEYINQNQALGYQVLSEPMWNKGESAWQTRLRSGDLTRVSTSSPQSRLFTLLFVLSPPSIVTSSLLNFNLSRTFCP